MTVKELIASLQELDGELEVVINEDMVYGGYRFVTAAPRPASLVQLAGPMWGGLLYPADGSPDSRVYLALNGHG